MYFCTSCILFAYMCSSGFSWPSSALISSAGKTSAKAIGTAFAPIVFQVSRATGLAITRTFRPLTSSSLLTLRLLFDRLRKPMPVHVRPTRPAGSIIVKIFFDDAPSSTA